MKLTLVLLTNTILFSSMLTAQPAAVDPPRYDIAGYYWPNFHVDPRNKEKLGKGWTEWELVRNAVPRFTGHEQPRKPLWGYAYESNPKTMARVIDTMADHGTTAVIFDWYYYNSSKPALEGALRDGFLKAENRHRVKFSLMWANHDYVDLFPASPGKPN
jgi:hypothetical protein